MHLFRLAARTLSVLLTLCVALTLAVPACAGGTGWTTHRDPRGYVVDVPAGWTLTNDDTQHRALITGPDGARVSLQGISLKAPVVGVWALLWGQQFAEKAAPHIHWGKPQAVGTSVGVITGDGAQHGKAFFTWAASMTQSVVWLYLETGSPAALANDRATIGHIFTSYRVAELSGAPAASAAAAQPAPLRYTTFRDPQEGMFTVQLPAGWRASGGSYRQSSLDTRPAFSAVLPGKAIVQSGDPAYPFYVEPNAGTQFGNMRNGSPYQMTGVTAMLEPFVEGAPFAQGYVQQHFASMCSGIHLEQVRPRSDAVAALNQTYAQTGVPMQVSAGDAAFSCTLNGKPARGYVFAGTQLVKMGEISMWNVQFLLSYLATSDTAAQAHAALEHAAATYQIDPDWAARNTATTARISEITRETGDQISKIISDTYWHDSATAFNAIEHYDTYAVRGHQIVTDPENPGSRFEIDDRYEYNFLGPHGTILGSDINAKPGPQFRSLIASP
jgi:hypothetical protein